MKLATFESSFVQQSIFRTSRKIFASSKRLILINAIVDIDGHFPHLRIACHHEERWKMKSEDFTFTQLASAFQSFAYR